jgi:hypothetical protein
MSLREWGCLADEEQGVGLSHDPGAASGAVDPAHFLLAVQQFRQSLGRSQWQQESLADLCQGLIHEPLARAYSRGRDVNGWESLPEPCSSHTERT